MPKLTSRNYYSLRSNQDYWSASFVKSMLQCPERALAEFVWGTYVREPSDALLIGSYVDAFFESSRAFKKFCNEHQGDMFNKRTGELYAKFADADDMIARARRDPLFMEFMNGKHQAIWTGAIGGVLFKAKPDVYVPGERIVDLKTTKDMEPSYKEGYGMVNFAQKWDWPLQLAIYQELEFQQSGMRLPCYLAVITKQKPADIAIVQIPQETLDAEMTMLLDKIPLFEAMRNGVIPPDSCGHCEYCRENKVLTEPVILE